MLASVLYEGAESIICSPGYPCSRRGQGRMKLVDLDYGLLPRWPSLLLRINGVIPAALEKTRIVSLPGRLSLGSSCSRIRTALVVGARTRERSRDEVLMRVFDNGRLMREISPGRESDPTFCERRYS